MRRLFKYAIVIKDFFFFLCFSILVLMSCDSNKKVRIGQENAIWTEAAFFRGFNIRDSSDLAEEDILIYANKLKDNNIKYAFIFAGPFTKEGYLPDYAFSDAAITNVKLLKEIYPGIIVLPWIGGVQSKTVQLQDSVWVTNALNDSKRLIETLSVTGLHFDFEFILEGNPFFDRTEIKGGSIGIESYGNNVNEFHKKFRIMMPEAFISCAIVAPSPGTKPWKRKTPLNELKVLVNYVDQISFLYYDTYLNKQSDFEENCSSLISDIQVLRNYNSNVQYLVAIGTFINPIELHKYRNMNIENIPNSLNTLKNCILNLSHDKQIVDGISIYCNWETDQNEWQQISKNWTGIN